jgi:hypothetical protein
MARSASSFNRPKARYKPQPTVLVICEDSKSGKRYLEDASLHFRVLNVTVEIAHCGKTDPLGIVKEAKRRAKAFDQIFCVIDHDSHPGFSQALSEAKNIQKIEIIASYPCFEFWLLLHFGYTRKPYAGAGKHSPADLLVKDLCAYTGFENYYKGTEMGIFSYLENRFADARRIAPLVLAEAIESGEMNPSTKLHCLIDTLEKLSLPQKVS